jgi:2-phosphosulfolactate phosphatase
MKINKLDFVSGARKATGLAVIIDVFRAFSLACYAVENGARRVIPVGEVETAWRLREQLPDCVLVGERHTRKIEGFNYGNSPTEIDSAELSGRTIVHTTHAGTQGLVNALQAEEVITGSFVNAGAIVDYVRYSACREVSFVSMGTEGVRQTDEDSLCADYLAHALSGEKMNFEEIRDHLQGYESARKFYDPQQPWAPETDFDLCMSLDRFPFVLRRRPWGEGLFALEKVTPAAQS